MHVENIYFVRSEERSMRDLRYLDDVSTLVLDSEKCIGCSLCTHVCPQAVFEMVGNKAFIVDANVF